MSDINNLTKSQRKRRRQAEKRKASGSPSTENGVHNTSSCNVDSPSVTNTELDFYQISDDYVRSVMNYNTSPTMNLEQQNAYGFQTPQPVQQPTGTSAPPSWALALIEDVKSIKNTMKVAIPKIELKVDLIEKSVNRLNSKFSDMEIKVTTMENKIRDIDKSVSFINEMYETQKCELAQSKEDLERLEKQCEKIGREIDDSKKREELANEKLLDLEARSMRENLIFYGLAEQTSGMENCESLVKNFITTKLGIDASGMSFDRAHRLGGQRARKPRPIVVKFHRYADREAVRQKSYEDPIKKSLKDSNLGVGIQSPQQYREARKALFEHGKREENRGNRTRIVGNKLYVNNKITKTYNNGNVYDYKHSDK